MAIDPVAVVHDMRSRARRSAPAELPALPSRPVAGSTPLAPLCDHPDLETIHRQWQLAHQAEATPSTPPRRRFFGLRRGGRAGAESALTARQEADRAIIGAVIRAVSTLASRCDELAARTSDLESRLGEAFDALGADVARMRATLDARDRSPGDDAPPATADPRDQSAPSVLGDSGSSSAPADAQP